MQAMFAKAIACFTRAKPIFRMQNPHPILLPDSASARPLNSC